MCFGKGLPPTKFETKQITVGLNRDYTSIITFRNPFKD